MTVFKEAQPYFKQEPVTCFTLFSIFLIFLFFNMTTVIEIVMVMINW